MGKHKYVKVHIEQVPKPKRPKPEGLQTHEGRRQRAHTLHRYNQIVSHSARKQARKGRLIDAR